LVRTDNASCDAAETTLLAGFTSVLVQPENAMPAAKNKNIFFISFIFTVISNYIKPVFETKGCPLRKNYCEIIITAF